MTIFKFFRLFFPLMFLSMAEGEGGGGDNSGGRDADPNEGFKNLLKKHENDARAVAQLLYSENYQHRTEIRDLQKELDRVRKQVPAEGSVILSAEDAAAWAKYQALGKPEELETVKADNQRMKREQVLSQVAEAHKYKVSVLQTLAGDLPFEIREVDRDGQKHKVAFVKVDGQDKALPDYAKEKWADFLPSLEIKEQQQPTTSLPRQSVGGSAKGGNVVQQTLSKRYAPRQAQQEQ